MTPVRSALVAVLVPLMLALAVAPAFAVASGATADQVVSKAAADLLGTPDPNQRGRADSATELFASVRDHSDIGAWLSAQAAVLSNRGELESAMVADAPAAAPSGSVAQAVSAGDLDGDGRADVAVLSRDISTGRVTLAARRGTDAAQLWQREAAADGSLAIPLRRDVNGDGRADLLQHNLKLVQDGVVCSDEACSREQYNASFTWTVGVLSGANGSLLWSRTLDGALEEITDRTAPKAEGVSFEVAAETYTLRSSNLYLFSNLADLQGDGAPELLVQAVDLVLDKDSRRATASGDVFFDVEDAASSVHATTRIDILNPRDGVIVQQLGEQTDGQIGLVYAYESARGAVRDNLLWQRSLQPPSVSRCIKFSAPKLPTVQECADQPEKPRTELRLIDGRTFHGVWNVTFNGAGEAVPLSADVDSDGLGDLYIGLSGGDWAFENRIVSGANGATAWSEPGHLTLLAADPIDTTAGDDLIFAAAHAVEQGEAIELQRRNGATGARLFTTTHDFGWTGEGDFVYPFMYASALGDGNNDGVADVTAGIMRVIAMQQPDGSYLVTQIDSQAVAESGKTGAALRTVDSTDIAYMRIGADFDGDALADVMDERYTTSGVMQTGSFTPVRLVDNRALWTDRSTGNAVEFTVGGDTNGDAGRELLRHVHTSDATRSATVVSAISGRTGLPLWSVASAP